MLYCNPFPLLCLALSALTPLFASEPPGGSDDWALHETGKASWYGTGHHGGPTASGQRYNQAAMTAAHKKLPFGTYVKVTNLKNGRSCIVRVNDRGPFIKGRVIDLSAAAAKIIGVHSAGIAPVKLELIRDVTHTAKKKKRRPKGL